MSRDRNEIDRVRTSIASIVYNDCLPTSLTTNSLTEICFQYNNYVKASESSKGGSSQLKQQEALQAIRASIDLINKQSVSSGASHGVLYPKGDSLDDIRDIGETIAVIYAIPYKAAASIDYVGYAYGIAAPKWKSAEPYEFFAPDDYINQCSCVALDLCSQRESRDLLQKMKDCANAFNYFKSIETGEIVGNSVNAQNLMAARVRSMDEEIESIAGVKPEHNGSVMAAQIISSCMKSSFKFSQPSAIEELREEGVFKDTEVLNRAIEM